jgi:hypothetical protein
VHLKRHQRNGLRAFLKALKTGAPYTIHGTPMHKTMRELRDLGLLKAERTFSRKTFWSITRKGERA